MRISGLKIVTRRNVKELEILFGAFMALGILFRQVVESTT